MYRVVWVSHRSGRCGYGAWMLDRTEAERWVRLMNLHRRGLCWYIEANHDMRHVADDVVKELMTRLRLHSHRA